ncbi:hypothetical protein [Chelatococcus asaccharovorans]|uniref:hypothetical protein n=1 Tax=Chelatococcus asaccharovorans TaxID=28210 RepID=UPI000D766DBC|nr:hypothetical protein [Chelatococcus asaccharovorans]MBS7706483.1 hypothetical protein [Chelatococcus asaccharovorans]
MEAFLASKSQGRGDCQEGTFVRLPLDGCVDFIKTLQSDGRCPATLAGVQGAAFFADYTFAIDTLLAEKIRLIRSRLGDADCGIVAIDIPEGIVADPTADALMGAIIASAITSAFMVPSVDRRNGTPFTIYTASQANEAALQKAGVKFYSPNERLGFHTDGMLRESAVYVPRYIALYNIIIAYNKPGCFYWVPFAGWPQFDVWAGMLGWNRPYRFEATPIVYAGALDRAEDTRGHVIEAPVFWHDAGGGDRAVFMNGELLGPVDGDEAFDYGLVARMKRSIACDASRIALPQRQRRLLLMNNTAGFHARDLFDEPIPGARYTRSFMRSVASEGPRITA